MAPKSSDLTRLRFGASAAAHIRRTGRTPMGDAIWTQHEIEVCRTHHPDFKVLIKRLPRRSRGAIAEMCRRLRLTDPPSPWTAADKSRLRKMFSDAAWEEICAAFPNRTKNAITRVAYKWGFRRTRKPYKKTYHDALDQVRQRCLNEGLYMPDLDDFSKTGRYFSKRAYRKKKPDFKAIERAARLFGGRLLVEWSKDDEL